MDIDAPQNEALVPIVTCSNVPLPPYLYHVEAGVGEPLTSQARVSLPPTRAAEPTRRRPNVGDVLGEALHALTTRDLPP
jgi:hypothetical protein